MLKAICILLALHGGTAHADDTVATYAIVVGSNAGGPGQTDLRYAEDDARRVGAVLVELGGYAPERVDVSSIRRPTQLRRASTRSPTSCNADLAAGRQSRVFFYYGVTRARRPRSRHRTAALAELRQRLFAAARDADRGRARCLPERRVLARQGRPARGRLLVQLAAAARCERRRGARVVSGQRAVQESESSSRRTSRTTCWSGCAARATPTGMASSRSTKRIATRIARRCSRLRRPRSAASTSSLEVDLKGHGEVPLSYPRAATSSSSCPRALEGKTLVEDSARTRSSPRPTKRRAPQCGSRSRPATTR